LSLFIIHLKHTAQQFIANRQLPIAN